MDFEETNETEDLLDEVVEEPEEVEAESLETLNEDPPEEPKAKEEPGYVRKRIDSAVQKALAQERESIRAEMEKQYAPIMERLLEMDAQELVRTNKVGDIDTARELVRLRQGITPQVERTEPPQEDAATAARIDMLRHQADRIKADTGVDVIAEWNRNKEIKEAVINGEMDFYDVAKQMGNKKRPPSPMRSPNGASSQINAIESMSDAQFKKLEERIKKGARYTLR